MNRLLGMAALGGLTVSLGMCAFPDAASAAPASPGPSLQAASKGGAGQGAANGRATPPAQAAAAKTPGQDPAKPPGSAATPGKSLAAPGQAKWAAGGGKPTGQARAAAARALARSNRPGSPTWAVGPDRAALVHSLKGAVTGQLALPTASAPAAPSAVTAAAPVAAAAATKVTICHATGSASNPFVLITIDDNALPPHLSHGDVAPVGGACPGAVTPPVPGGKVTICHRTGSDTNPFVVIIIDDNALPAHLGHGDVSPVGGACPGAIPPVTPTPVTPGPGVLPEQVTPVRATGGGVLPFQVREVVDSPVVEAQVLRAPVEVQASPESSLPRTGFDVGSTVLIALLLLVVGATAATTGDRRLATSTATASSSSAIGGSEAGTQAPPATRRSPASWPAEAPWLRGRNTKAAPPAVPRRDE